MRASLQIMEETRRIPDVIDAVRHHPPAPDALMVSQDMVERRTAFAEKRPPRWAGR
ncbi:hypothetical protein [Pseudonocardia sp. DLS-67]